MHTSRSGLKAAQGSDCSSRELENGHSGEEIAKHVLQTMDWYVFRDRLGFITGGNATMEPTILSVRLLLRLSRNGTR